MLIHSELRQFNSFQGAPCPTGWTAFKTGYCYLVSSSIKTWYQAQAYCQARKGALVKINSGEENEFVLELARKNAPSVKQVWIGLKWESSVNKFLWYDKSFPVYTNWAPHEPNGHAGEPCGHLFTGHTSYLPNRASGYWNDLTCGIRTGWHCGLVCKRLP